jgi:hypothetical protein
LTHSVFLLIGIREYLKTLPKPSKDRPRYVIVIEEAHTIVGRSGEARASPDIADPKAFAAEYVCRMLAEVRALPVAVTIVDQFPSKVALEVIKSSTTKLELCQQDKDDRELIGAAMLMTPMEIEELARLNPGDAFFLTEGYHRSRRIKTVNLHAQYDFSSDVINEKILPYIRGDAWFEHATAERAISELTELRQRTERFENGRLQLISELASLLAREPRILARPRLGDRSKGLAELKNKACQLKKRLSSAYDSFLRNSYRRYLAPETGCGVQDPMIEEMRNTLVTRFESIIKNDVEKGLDVIDSFIRRCQTT